MKTEPVFIKVSKNTYNKLLDLSSDEHFGSKTNAIEIGIERLHYSEIGKYEELAEKHEEEERWNAFYEEGGFEMH